MARHGKYSNYNPQDPRAAAMDDYSGFLCPHNELVRQMEYRGSGLVWTSFMVNLRFMDKPNPQYLTPVLTPDPEVVPYPRPCPTLTTPVYGPPRPFY